MSNQHVRELSSDLVVLSARLVREVRRNSAELPAATTRLLSLLDELEPSTITVLTEADRCSQPTMTGLVNGLVANGWAQREPHPEDARSTVISMTPDGRRILTSVRNRNATLVAARIAASGRTTAELATAVAVLTDLVEGTTC